MAKRKVSFEDAMQRLEEILMKLDTDNIPLEDAIALYKEGMQMAAVCNEKLTQAQGEIKIYTDGVWEKEEKIDE